MASFYDRVQERWTGTDAAPGAAITLPNVAVTDHRTFSSVFANGERCYYCIVNPGKGEWEIGFGTFATAGPTLTRTTVLASSTGSAIQFTAGTKLIFNTLAGAHGQMNDEFSPFGYGGKGDASTDDTTAINAMTAAALATAVSNVSASRGKMTLGGKRFNTTGPINLTMFRQGLDACFRNGVIHPNQSGGIVMDLTGTRHIKLEDITISMAPGVSIPDYGLVFQRVNLAGSSGDQVEEKNILDNVQVRGTFNDACILNYGSEIFSMREGELTNDSTSLTSYCLVLTYKDDIFTPGSSFVTGDGVTGDGVSTGAQSFNRKVFNNLTARRTAITSWNLSDPAGAPTALYSVGVTTQATVDWTGGTIPTLGNLIVLDQLSVWTQLNDGVYQVGTIISTVGNITTFELLTEAGASIDSSGYGAFSGTTGNFHYKTGPVIFCEEDDRTTFDHLYMVAYGTEGLEFKVVSNNECHFFKVHGHMEGGAIQAWMHFNVGTHTLNLYDLDLYEHNSQVKQNFFKTTASGSGQINLWNPKISIGAYSTALVGSVFQSPSYYYLYNAEIDLPSSAAMPNWWEFGYFTGTIHYRDTGMTIKVTDRRQIEEYRENDATNPYVYKAVRSTLDEKRFADLGTTYTGEVFITGGGTNQLQRSEELDNAYWTKTNCSVTANAANGPDGVASADLVTEDTSSGNHGFTKSAITTILANQAAIVSMAIKPVDRTTVWLYIMDSTSVADNVLGQFDLVKGTVTGVQNNGLGTGARAGIMALPGGWFKIWVSGTPSSAANNTRISLRFADSGSVSYTGTSKSLYATACMFHAVPASGLLDPGPYVKTTSAAITNDVSRINTPGGLDLTVGGSLTLNAAEKIRGIVFASASASGTGGTSTATANGTAGILTTAALTTAAGASHVMTVTNSYVAAGDMVALTLQSDGTNTAKNLTLKSAVTGASTFTVTIDNDSAGAVNGTIKFNYQVIKA